MPKRPQPACPEMGLAGRICPSEKPHRGSRGTRVSHFISRVGRGTDGVGVAAGDIALVCHPWRVLPALPVDDRPASVDARGTPSLAADDLGASDSEQALNALVFLLQAHRASGRRVLRRDGTTRICSDLSTLNFQLSTARRSTRNEVPQSRAWQLERLIPALVLAGSSLLRPFTPAERYRPAEPVRRHGGFAADVARRLWSGLRRGHGGAGPHAFDPQVEGPPVSDPGKAVFLSYASQDAAAAKRIAEALRGAGIEVWFDQNELVGGDAWDAKIRGQIASCALFVPVISAATQARLEGYFRIEWKLAAQRTHAMAEEKTFLVPVVIDDIREAEAKVPADFRSVQWTKLPGGEMTPAFAARIHQLLGGRTNKKCRATLARRASVYPCLFLCSEGFAPLANPHCTHDREGRMQPAG
jgi:hypothetical protein